MTEPSSWIDWVVGTALAVMAWLGNRLHLRVDQIEESRAKNEDLTAVRQDLKSLREHFDSRLDNLTTQIMSNMRNDR